MDIESIFNESIQENQKIEYKNYFFEDGKLNSLGNKQKNTLLKEITSFANSEGGNIIIGIAEDDNHNPEIMSDVGVNSETWEEWEQSFRLLCKSKIRPVLHGLSCKLIEYNNKYLIEIEIPKSILKPHSFYDGNKDEFYIRYGNISNHMSYDDLRRSFTELDSIESNVSTFRDNRIAMILNNEIFNNFENETILVLHIIPNWSMGLSNSIDMDVVDLDIVEEENLFDVFSPRSSSGHRRGELNYNTDGVIVSYGENLGFSEFPVDSYTQIFHNGAIESVEVRMMNYSKKQNNIIDNKNRYIYNLKDMGKLLYDNILRNCRLLREANVPKPYNVSVSILNGKGKKAIRDNDFGYLTKSLPREIIKFIPAYITEDRSIEESLTPLFMSFANSFGLKELNILEDIKENH